MALYAYHRGDYSLAKPEFEKLANRFHRSGDGARFVECSIYVLRLLAEQEAFADVSKIETRILEFFANQQKDTSTVSPKLLSRMHYVLGICLVYQGEKHEAAMERFRNSIQFAMACQDRSALAWPLYGAATVLYARGRYEDALQELEKLTTLLSCNPISELSSSSLLLRALILRNRKDVDGALSSAWSAFESLKEQPHLGLYLHTLATLGTILRDKGDAGAARIYLDLAQRSLKRTEFPRIARIVDEALVNLRDTKSNFDLLLDLETNRLTVLGHAEVRFDGQFLLRDLLTVFMRAAMLKPGVVLKKELLVREVWNESYRPQTHDNKIYVNIKRLRRLLESEGSTTEFILRGKEGYYLNPKLRLEIIENNEQLEPREDAVRPARALGTTASLTN